MSNGISDFYEELQNAKDIIGSVDWDIHTITKEKAYLNAIFSKVAYLDLPEFELKEESRVKIIPCETYWELFDRGVAHDVRDFLYESEFENFVFRSESIIVVGIATTNVIIVSIRGTRLFHVSDWNIDLAATPKDVIINNETVKFHKGFFSATAECLPEIVNEVNSLRDGYSSNVPVYVTGHSLGGAIAAIIFGLDGKSFSSNIESLKSTETKLDVFSCYSYGMPQFGDFEAIKNLKSPIHIYNSADLIPGLPAESFGYSRVRPEFPADDFDPHQPKPYQRLGFRLKNPLKGIMDHRIECYIRSLRICI